MESPVWFWSAFVATGVLLVVLAWYGNRRRRLSPVEAEANEEDLACGRCGYSVFGLPGETCPECAANLNEVGLTTSKFRRWQNAPPVLRAVVWTLGIAVVATPILVTAFTEFLPTTRVRSNEVPYGNPVVLKVVERHVDRSAGRMFGLFTPREELEHVVEATSADRSARLTWDVPGDRWTLRTRNSEDSGVGRPSLESIEQMAAAVAGRPATRPASIESIPVNAAGAVVQPPPAEAIRVILHWHLRALPPALVRKRSLAIVVRQNGPVAEGVPNEWMTEPQTMPFARSLAYQAPLVTGNQTSRSKPMLALTYASWPLVWLLGLPLVLRRRAVRVQSHDRLAGQEKP